MSSRTVSAAAPLPAQSPPSWLTFLLASACGLIAANVYYAQPLIGMISSDLGLSPRAAGLIVTLTQLGYAAGLVLIVPLADLIENRRLAVGMIGVGVVALAGAAMATHVQTFLIASLLIGFGSVSVQILVPYAAHLAPEAIRGRTVGNVMSGLMLGIMLARPVASLMADHGSWHTVFVFSSVAMALLAVSLRIVLPVRKPQGGVGYGRLLASMAALARKTPVLQRRSIYQSFQFGAFTLFWTVIPLLLTGPVFRLSQTGVALFALAGVAGAIAAPIAGRLADRGWTRRATGLGLLAVAVAFLMTHVAEPGSTPALALLVAAAILLDFGVTATLVLGQREIFAIGGEIRGRLNGIYMTTWYIGGALGSAVGGWSYAQGGWLLASCIGLALPLAGLLYYATEK
ncbi:MFS transporter [Achromobacter marplatensis]|uniref:MFS transporter n=1 Tax=Achromobacter marplatensis TaxID=470868 RepID=UPI0028E2F0AB|nr:MFS transporter [Achromobacter marplatensis]